MRPGAGGRPVAGVKRSATILVRVTPAELAAVDASTEASGAASRSDWSREVLLAAAGYDPVIVPPDTDGDDT